MTKAVIFDCFGVLIGEMNGKIIREYPNLKDAIRELDKVTDIGQMDYRERTARTEKLLDGEGLDGRKILKDIMEGAEVNFELFDFIGELHKQYKTGILSNTGGLFWQYFDREEMAKYFDDVLLSYEVGIVKPDLRIFELAAERLGVLPEECVFVDDNEGNVQAAEGCGMKGVLYEWGMDLRAHISRLCTI